MATNVHRSDEPISRFGSLFKVFFAIGLALVIYLVVSPNFYQSKAESTTKSRNSVQEYSNINLDDRDLPTSPIRATQVYTTYLPIIYSDRIEPGLYPFNRCTQFSEYGDGEMAVLAFCVMSVEVKTNYEMQFNVSWTVLYLTSGVLYVIQHPDIGNTNMYLTDTIGNRYDHIEVGGAAAETSYFYDVGDTHSGWFLFPSAKPGAKSFRFYDDDQHVFIDGINFLE